MSYVFLVCAAIGGTILLCQLAMTLIGLGGHGLDGDFSGDAGHGFGGDFHGDAGGDFHGDAGTDFHGGAGDVHGGADHAGSADHDGSADQPAHGAAHLSTTWLFSVLSFRTVVAGMTFFGLAGLAAREGKCTPLTTFGVALAAGAGALYGMYWLMRGLYSLKAEGTVRIQRSLGLPATVYLRIPGHESGMGKIQINLQNRTMEYSAVTSGDAIPTGATVVVVGIVGPDTLSVQPFVQSERVAENV